MGIDRWIATTTDSTPITAEMLERTIREVSEADRGYAVRQVEAATRFIESVPEHLRDHGLVRTIASIIANGIVLHPDLAADYKRQYEELLHDPR